MLNETGELCPFLPEVLLECNHQCLWANCPSGLGCQSEVQCSVDVEEDD